MSDRLRGRGFRSVAMYRPGVTLCLSVYRVVTGSVDWAL